jgi:O-antigen/teichoic acid export membrane protein
MVNNLGMALSNIVLNFIFISVFGLIGAAVATAVSVISINIIMIVEVWWFEGLVPYTRSFYKPVIAGAVSFLSMIVIRILLPTLFEIDSIAVMFIGGGVGVATYAASISTFGIEETDRQLISSLMPK